MSMTPNEYPATADCPQCEHEVEATLYLYRDGSGAFIYGKHCPECDEAVAMDMSFTLPGAVRWNALRAWLTGERISLESRIRQTQAEPAKLERLRGSRQEVVMALQRMDDLEKATP